MLEILLVVAISKKIAAMMTEKGRSAAGYVTFFVLLWFGGEIFGFIVGMIISQAQNPNAFDGGFDFLAYIIGLAGAAIGGTVGYLFAAAMPPLEDPRKKALEVFDEDYDDEDDRERERRRRRRESGDGSFEGADR